MGGTANNGGPAPETGCDGNAVSVWCIAGVHRVLIVPIVWPPISLWKVRHAWNRRMIKGTGRGSKMEDTGSMGNPEQVWLWVGACWELGKAESHWLKSPKSSPLKKIWHFLYLTLAPQTTKKKCQWKKNSMSLCLPRLTASHNVLLLCYHLIFTEACLLNY